MSATSNDKQYDNQVFHSLENTKGWTEKKQVFVGKINGGHVCDFMSELYHNTVM
jgi:hypothetical protein